MARRPRWCDHIDPATAVVECNGERHRVTWRRGKVVLEDHDLGAETAMLAFGGKPFACLSILKRWRDLHTWALSAELFRQMQASLGPEGVLPQGLGPVHELGLMLTWERNWRRWSYYGEHERLLLEQLKKRALSPLREHLNACRKQSGARLISSAELRVQRPGREPTLVGSMDTVRVSATAALGVSWMLGVWGRGLAVVDGAFVLEVLEEASERPDLAVRAVRWEARADGRWSPVSAPALVGLDDKGQRWLRWNDAAEG